MEQTTAISLFAGCGGLDLGFEWAGIRIIWATDIDRDACATYRLNFPNVAFVQRDIRSIPIQDIPDADILIGGFPCQGFSLGGCRRLDDPRNSLYLEYKRVLSEKRPKMFIAENVKGLLTMGRGKVIETIKQEFRKQGYRVDYRLFNARQFGVAQDRERVFIVGIRDDLPVSFSFPEPTYGPGLKYRFATLRDKIWDIRHNPGEWLEGSYSSRFMSRQRKRGWDEVGFCVQACAKQNALHPDGELMRKISPDVWEFVGTTNRRLSINECKLIQSFPRNFKVLGSVTSQYKQIGNAVPPLLAQAVASQVLSTLKSLSHEAQQLIINIFH